MTTLNLHPALEHTGEEPHDRNFQALQAALNALGIYAGTGSPEAVVTAGIGSIYRRLDGGAGTSIYIKESGVGNVGWIGK